MTKEFSKLRGRTKMLKHPKIYIALALCLTVVLVAACGSGNVISGNSNSNYASISVPTTTYADTALTKFAIYTSTVIH